MKPQEKMKVTIQHVSFEKARGRIVESHARRSLTLIVNEHMVQREGESSDENMWETRALYHFEIRSIRSTIPNSVSESILTFWSMHIKFFMFFVCTGGKIKLLPMTEVNVGIVIVDFISPGDAQQFYHYALKNHRQRRVILSYYSLIR